ncbi:flagellar hook assembly protein FlgD [Sphingomonas sp. ID0503]|uniref:flagellar hook assembly protein FlgD n=1 Tax=Sphingomonas sp. ID0503 TaxID=3399691 RepID=UPI003AFB0AC1
MTSVTDNFNNVMSNLGIKSGTKGSTVKDATALDQSSFLKLMTAQLKNQDPFEPMDNSQMVSQMAQMSQVSGVAEMNTTLKNLAAKLSGGSTADAVALVGKTVLVEGKTAYPSSDGSVTAKAVLANDADSVQVAIKNAAGNTVRTLDLDKQTKGTIEFTWDGKDASGNAVSGGPFTLSATAKVDGLPTALTTQVWAPVTSVALSQTGGAPTLQIAGIGEKPLSSVIQVG